MAIGIYGPGAVFSVTSADGVTVQQDTPPEPPVDVSFSGASDDILRSILSQAKGMPRASQAVTFLKDTLGWKVGDSRQISFAGATAQDAAGNPVQFTANASMEIVITDFSNDQYPNAFLQVDFIDVFIPGTNYNQISAEAAAAVQTVPGIR